MGPRAPKNLGDLRLQVPVLDRLLDDKPKEHEEAALTRAQSLRIYKNAVRRDLEWLLNTRAVPDFPPENLNEVLQSVYCYGMPDFSVYTMSSSDARGRLLSQIKNVVEFFEPRLKDVVVSPREDPSAGLQTLAFTISALLMMDPAPEQVSFDTVLELQRHEYQVKGDF